MPGWTLSHAASSLGHTAGAKEATLLIHHALLATWDRPDLGWSLVLLYMSISWGKAGQITIWATLAIQKLGRTISAFLVLCKLLRQSLFLCDLI